MPAFEGLTPYRRRGSDRGKTVFLDGPWMVRSGQSSHAGASGASAGPVDPVPASPRAGIRAERTPARYPGDPDDNPCLHIPTPPLPVGASE